ncbi:lipopolysaccharide biosynthesis protein [Mycolicibacterium sp. CBMA 226]|uniref:lipopolysaccharide biosynthesis protein n=1 Tax=Mycolicibacterium sp. CBMA 226 TaxID=2606611 RepID=UPI0012DCC363|nr:oligosaccharide flippase family protein [Mycolicibacterium sp. CBMA 226]MUL76163.1 oligosaccharide flippase family protein [Mycolicibacterium sp. CBMA 226]
MAHPNRGIQSLKAGSAAQVVSIVAGFGVQLLTTPYVLFKLGLHDFGVWSITGAIAQYGALFDLGVSRAASRYVAVFHSKGEPRNEGRVVAVCVATLFGVAAMLSGLVLLTSQLIAPVLGLRDPRQAGTLLLVAVAILFVGLLARVLAAASIGRGRTVPPLTAVAIMSALQALGGVAVLAEAPSLLGFAYGTLGGISLGLVVVIVVILADEGRITFAMPNKKIAREIFAYGISSQIAALGDLLLFQSGKLVAGALIGPSAAGVYELASRPAMAAQVLGASPGTALMPHLTRIYVSGGLGGILTEYEHLTRRNTSVALLIPFAMAATAVAAIPVWLNGPHLDVVAVLLALLIGISVNVSTSTCTCTLLAMGRPVMIAKVTAVAGVLQLIAAVLATKFFGFTGLTVAIAVGVPVTKLAGLWLMQASAHIPQRFYLRAAGGPYAIAILAALLAAPIGLLTMPQNRQSAIVPFIFSALVYASIYLFLGWRCGYLPRASNQSSELTPRQRPTIPILRVIDELALRLRSSRSGIRRTSSCSRHASNHWWSHPSDSDDAIGDSLNSPALRRREERAPH